MPDSKMRTFSAANYAFQSVTRRGVHYQYINDGRLTHVTSGGNVYELKYDALGRTVSRTLNNQTTYFYYDGEWSELGSRDMDGWAGMGNL